jgi:EAL domain-containing protein (putative c-di-GMP-specific phosphodiesterase class I)
MTRGAHWSADGLDLKISINICADSLHRLDLPETVVDLASDSPSNMILEVTEARLMADLRKPLEILAQLRMKEIGISIDDFDTGYSSIEQLKRIPFTELKIDRAFVNGAADDAAARAILELSVDLAKKLGMQSVAEGVETQEDWDLVASLGCDLVQAYFIAKPMPGDDLTVWLRDR